MSAPLHDPQCPLVAIPQPVDGLLSSNRELDATKFKALLKQALQLYHAGQTSFTPTKTFNVEHGAVVKTSKGLPTNPPTARLKSCAWHARISEHAPDKLQYQDFYEGLAVDHPVKEKQYIHDILKYDRIGDNVKSPPLVQELSAVIADVRADLWLSEYELPIVVTNRDFAQLFLSVDLQPHADPLSKDHIDSVIAALDGNATVSATSNGQDNLRKSSVNIQLPIASTECPPQQKFVRAFYASVETVKEMEDGGTEWWMAVQSDSSGRVPLFFQETAMPSKIAPDVPAFIGWALKQKA